MVPKSTGLAVLVLAVACLMGATGPEHSALVAKLGSPKYAEREAASAALEKLGLAAFPVLKAARNDPDAEIKNRAEVVLEGIERSMLSRPVVVHLDARTYTLGELAGILGSSQGLAIGPPEARELVFPARRSLELKEHTELGFWDVLDRLGMTIQWEVDNSDDGNRGGFGGGGFNGGFRRPPVTRQVSSVRLVPKSQQPLPTSESGPFRVMVSGPTTLALENNLFTSRIRNGSMTFRNGNDGEAAPVLPLEILAEPRLALRSLGTIRVTEAIDGDDDSIVSRMQGELDPVQLVNADRLMSVLKMRLRMKGLETPPRILKSLKGTIPVEIEGRRIEPIVIAIPEIGPHDQKPVNCGDIAVQVHGVSASQFGFRGTYTVDMTLRKDGWTFFGLGGRRGVQEVGSRIWQETERFWDSVEIVDAKGRAYRARSPRTMGGEGDAAHIQYNVEGGDELGPPTQFRFYGGMRTMVEIPFEFKDLKLRR